MMIAVNVLGEKLRLPRKVLRAVMYGCLAVIMVTFIVLLYYIPEDGNTAYRVMGTVGLTCSLIMLLLSNVVRRDRHAIEAAITESAARYRAIISASNTGAWEYHADTQYQWCSEEYFQMLGYSSAMFTLDGKIRIQDTWMRLLHPEDRQLALDSFAKHIASRSSEVYQATFRMKHRNGEWRWIWSRGRTLPRRDGTMSSVTLGTHIDITDRKAMEIDLISYNLKLLKYAHLTAHQVRGPVARLMGLVQISKLESDIEYSWFFEKLCHEAHEIDKILKVITQELNEIHEHRTNGHSVPVDMNK